MAEGSAGREGGRDAGQRDPPDKLLDLVVQCAVQAQLAYHNEFKSEVRAKWLESFLGHEYLHVERVGGRECRIVYRGLSGLNDCSWRDYLGTMLRGSPQEYKCSYQVGTPDTLAPEVMGIGLGLGPGLGLALSRTSTLNPTLPLTLTR